VGGQWYTGEVTWAARLSLGRQDTSFLGDFYVDCVSKNMSYCVPTGCPLAKEMRPGTGPDANTDRPSRRATRTFKEIFTVYRCGQAGRKADFQGRQAPCLLGRVWTRGLNRAATLTRGGKSAPWAERRQVLAWGGAGAYSLRRPG